MEQQEGERAELPSYSACTFLASYVITDSMFSWGGRDGRWIGVDGRAVEILCKGDGDVEAVMRLE